jgi:hypothetical protein
LNAATNRFRNGDEGKKHEENYLSTELNALLLEVIETISNWKSGPRPLSPCQSWLKKMGKNMIQDI